MKKMYHFLQNTKRLRSITIKFLALFISYALLSPIILRPCTIAVVSGSVTLDGRPLLWKNRDVTDQDNVVRYFYGGRYPFIGITQAGDHESVYAGINTEGFAILNSVSYDLEGDGDTDHGRFMKQALEGCASIKLKESQCYSDPLSDRYINTYELVDESGKGILPYVRTLENEIFKNTEKTLQTWRQSFPSSSDIKNFQEDQTFWAYMRYSKQKSGYAIR